jgi:hypothetical protein
MLAPHLYGTRSLRAAGPGSFVDAALIRSVVAESTRNDAEFTRESVQVLSAFRTRKYAYNGARKAYE